MKNFFAGLSSYREAHRVVRRYRLWPYLVLPGILSLFYLCGLLVLAILYVDDLSAYLFTQHFPAAWQGPVFSLVAQALIWLVLLVLGYLTYQQVVLILFSPLLGVLSETVEKKLTGQEAPAFSIANSLKDIWRGVRVNLRYLFRSLLWSIPAWLAIFIPAAGALLSPLLLFIIQAYYGGAGLVDPNLERRRYTVAQSVDFVKQHRGRVLGVGSGFLLLLMIPLVGWFLAPSYGTIAAALAVLPTLNRSAQ